MAALAHRRSQNLERDLCVDRSCICIDCDTCRWMAPTIFARVEGQSAVSRQPESDRDRQAALRTLLSWSVSRKSDGCAQEEQKMV